MATTSSFRSRARTFAAAAVVMLRTWVFMFISYGLSGLKRFHSFDATGARLGAQPFMLMHIVARGRDCARKLARHGAAGRLVPLPFCLVGQRRDSDGLAEVEPGKGGVDHVVDGHYDLRREFMHRL